MSRSIALLFIVACASFFNVFAVHKNSPYKGKGAVVDGHSQVPCKVLLPDNPDSQLQFMYSHSYVRNITNPWGFGTRPYFDILVNGATNHLDRTHTQIQVSVSQNNQEVFGFTQPFFQDSKYALGSKTGQQMILGKKMYTFAASASFTTDNITMVPSGVSMDWIPGWYDVEFTVIDTSSTKKRACVRTENAFKVSPKFLTGRTTNLLGNFTNSFYMDMQSYVSSNAPTIRGSSNDPHQSFETIYVDIAWNEWSTPFYPTNSVSKPPPARATVMRTAPFTGTSDVHPLTVDNDGCGMNTPIDVMLNFESPWVASFMMPHCAGGSWEMKYEFPNHVHFMKTSFYAVERRVTSAGVSNIQSKLAPGTTARDWAINGIAALISQLFAGSGASPSMYISTTDVKAILAQVTNDVMGDAFISAHVTKMLTSATTQEIKDYIAFALYQINVAMANSPASRRLRSTEDLAATAEVNTNNQQQEGVNAASVHHENSKVSAASMTVVTTPNFCSTTSLEMAFKIINAMGTQLEILNEQFPNTLAALQALVSDPTTPAERAYYNELTIRDFVYTSMIGTFGKLSSMYLTNLQSLKTLAGDCYTVASGPQQVDGFTGTCGQPFVGPLYQPIAKLVIGNFIYAQTNANAAGFLFDEAYVPSQYTGRTVIKNAVGLLSPALQTTWNTGALRSAMQGALFGGIMPSETVTQIPFDSVTVAFANAVDFSQGQISCSHNSITTYFSCTCPVGSTATSFGARVHIGHNMATSKNMGYDFMMTLSACKLFLSYFFLLI
jgi:hypothetical protein